MLPGSFSKAKQPQLNYITALGSQYRLYIHFIDGSVCCVQGYTATN